MPKKKGDRRRIVRSPRPLTPSGTVPFGQGRCGVGATVALGLSALRRGLTDTTSLVTALPLFDGVDLDAPARFTVGGHEIRKAGFRQTVAELRQRANVFDPDLVAACSGDLEAWE